uniref:DNAJ-containing protein X-domain domain-containing protein n=1 Tax=Tetradesmus obliquus TaxID=3088 RepID=A0A383V3U9_TETOB|eukprot:jgi/Sobl393_1/12973/SZX60268.1
MPAGGSGRYNRHELEVAGMGLALQAMWAANVLDIQRTLHQVCKRLLREPGLPKPQAKLRAAALAELGRIYLEAQVPPELQKDTQQQMKEALEKLQELYMGQTAAEDAEAEAAEAAAAAAAAGSGAAGRAGASAGSSAGAS